MSDITVILRRFGGVASTAELRAHGGTKRALAAAVRRGAIVRQRIGHYCLPETSADIVQALRVGGLVCCVSAAEFLGMRVLSPSPTLHVSVDRHDSRFRSRASSLVRFRPTEHGHRERITLHWDIGPRQGQSRFLVNAEDCLVQLIGCLPAIDAICALDSALEVPTHGPFAGLPIIDGACLDRIRSRVSQKKATAVVDRANGLSQAIGESVARCWFEDAGIPTRPQAPLLGRYSGDLLIGDWLVFECDGEGPHSEPGAFDRDRLRRVRLVANGFHVVEFSHNQILNQWPMVLGTVQELMRHGLHLRPF